MYPDLESRICLLGRDYGGVAQLGDGQAINGKVGARRNQMLSEFTPGTFITRTTQSSSSMVTFSQLSDFLQSGRVTLLRKI